MAIDVSKPGCPVSNEENNIENVETNGNVEVVKDNETTVTNNFQLVSKFDESIIDLILSNQSSDTNHIKDICTNWNGVNEPGLFNIKKLNFNLDLSFTSTTFPVMYQKILANIYTLTFLSGKHLEKLSIPFECDTEILKIIKEHCPNLNYIHLPYIKFDDDKLTQVLSSVYQLNHLTIGNELCNGFLKFDRYMEALQNLPNSLVKLQLSLSYKSVHAFQPSPGSLTLALQNLNCLQTLQMSLFKLSMNDMIAISQLESLTQLDLNSSTLIEPRSIDLICNIATLEYFESDYDGVDDEFLINLSNGCKKLKGLTIYNTFGMTDIGVIELSKLEYLDSLIIHVDAKLVQIPCLITDASIGKFKNLKKLIVECIKGITNESIKKVIDNSPELEELDTTQTSTTLEILQYAANVTSTRTNNITLTYCVFDELNEHEYDYLCNLGNSSPFLIIDML